MSHKLFNRPLRILLATNGLVLLAGAMLGPIYALFVEEVGGDLLDASFAFAVFSVVAGITTVMAGKYTDQIRHNQVIMVLGYVLVGLGFLGYLLVDSVTDLLIVQVVVGLGEAIFYPAFDTLYSKHLTAHKLGIEWGAWEAVNYFAMAIGSIAGGLVVTYFGFSPIFVIMGLLCLLSAVYLWSLPVREL